MAFRYVDSTGARGTAESVMRAPALPPGYWWRNDSPLGQKPLWRAVPDPTRRGEAV